MTMGNEYWNIMPTYSVDIALEQQQQLAVPWSKGNLALQLISPYGSTKANGELMGHVYSHLYGIDLPPIFRSTEYVSPSRFVH
jgi:dTDP-D-glucose 4,6-dehydratase